MKPTTILAFAVFTATTVNANLTFQWQGVIDYLHEDKINAAPEGVDVGGIVTGTLQFKRSAYDSVSIIQGNYSGPRYAFTDNFLLEFKVGDNTWSFSGSNISLQYVNTIGPTTQLFEAHSTSDDFLTESFPDYAGSFNVGFFIRDKDPPLGFWDVSDIESTTFDVSQFTSGGGGINTVLLDSNDDAIDGYSFDFDITSLNVASVPEPSSYCLLFGSVVFALAFRRKIRTRR